jgi:hypothetical protein
LSCFLCFLWPCPFMTPGQNFPSGGGGGAAAAGWRASIHAYAAMLAERVPASARSTSAGRRAWRTPRIGLPDLGFHHARSGGGAMCGGSAERDEAPAAGGCGYRAGTIPAETGAGDDRRRSRRRDADRGDQVDLKRCGHRPGKKLVSGGEEMVERVRAAVQGPDRPGVHVIMARDGRRWRARGWTRRWRGPGAYVEAGADMIFAEALSLAGGRSPAFTAAAVPVPVLVEPHRVRARRRCFTTAMSCGRRAAGLVLYPLVRLPRDECRGACGCSRRSAEDGSQRAEWWATDAERGRTLYDVLRYDEFEAARRTRS